MNQPNKDQRKRSKQQSQVMKDKLAEKAACKQQMKNRFKSLDWFDQSLNLTWNGEDQFKTTFGAAVSLVLMLLLLAYTLYRLYYLAERFNPQIQKITLMRTPEEDLPWRPQDFGFDFAYGLRQKLDPSYGFFTAKYIEQDVVDGERKKKSNWLNSSQCGTTEFAYDEEQVVKFGISNFTCVTDDNYDFQGNFYRDNMRYVEIKLWKCLNSTKANTPYSQVTCKSKTEIDAYFSGEQFSFAFVNSLFVVDDFEDPILHYIDDSLFFELDPNKIKKANFFIQQSTAELEDDIIQFGQYNERTYHQIQNIRTYDDDYSDKDGYLVAVYMRSDKQYDDYQRKVTDLLTLLGDVGGLQGTLIAAGFLFVGFITSRMFMSKIVRKIYQIRKYENFEQDEQKANQLQINKPKNSPKSKVLNEDEEGNLAIQNRVQPQQDGNYKSTREPGPDQESLFVRLRRAIAEKLDIKKREFQLQKEFKVKKQFNAKDVGKVLFAFLNRTRFKYTIANIIEYIMKCMCVRNIDGNRRQKGFKKHFLFQKAEDKFSQELDAVRIIKTLRKFKMLAQAMLSQKHRLLLRFQRQNLVETSSSSSDSDNNNFDTVRLMENKNPLIRLVMYGKLKKMMTQFDGKTLEPLERNIMRGLFIKKLKDFAEDQADIAENESLIDRLLKDMKIKPEDDDQSKQVCPDRIRELIIDDQKQMAINYEPGEIQESPLDTLKSEDEQVSKLNSEGSRKVYVHSVKNQSQSLNKQQ